MLDAVAPDENEPSPAIYGEYLDDREASQPADAAGREHDADAVTPGEPCQNPDQREDGNQRQHETQLRLKIHLPLKYRTAGWRRHPPGSHHWPRRVQSEYRRG